MISNKSKARQNGVLRHSDTIRTLASLCLYGAELDPAEVTNIIGRKPSDSARKGDVHTSSSGKTRIAPIGRWILRSTKSRSPKLEAHIASLVSILEKASITPSTIPGVERTEVSCYWFSPEGTGPVLPFQLLERLGRLGLSLGIDVYFDDAEDASPQVRMASVG